MHHLGEEDGKEHAHESGVVVQADVVVDPDTVMVKLIHTSVTPLTVFGIFQYVSIAQIAVETIILIFEIVLRHTVFSS